MTVRLAIVNLSNWDGENFEFMVSQASGLGEGSPDMANRTIAPAEIFEFTPSRNGGTITFTYKEGKNGIEPFHDTDGDQAFPYCHTAFRKV